ncbi:MAG: helix-turn-helix transcriptional regulator, partial [Clostridia bacterium]|nr:helix-turn-helix transcriptional regulator [Clostridia bacterium]
MIENLKKLRTKSVISQHNLASAIGVSQQSINKYENHSVEPDITTLISMADYFGVTVAYLIGRESADDTHHLTPTDISLIRDFKKLPLK